MYAQGTDSDEISLILAGIDTLKSDSDKVTRLLGFAGQKYRYHKDSRQLLDKAGEIDPAIYRKRIGSARYFSMMDYKKDY